MKVVGKGRGKDSESTQRHMRKRERDNEAQGMTGQHSGCQSCFYMHRGYIIIILQKSQLRLISPRRVKGKGGSYGNHHRRGNQRV